MNKEQLQLFDKKTAQAIQNLIGFSYDNKTDKTRNVKNFLEDKKGICFDFVNYLYSINKKCQCYFVWFNNKESSTHTFIILNGYYIETTPETNRKNTLSSIYIEKATPENIIKRMAKQRVDFKNLYYKDDKPYDWCRYYPDNKEQSIKEFISKRFKEMKEKIFNY